METALRFWDFGDTGSFAEIPINQYPSNGLGDPQRMPQILSATALPLPSSTATGSSKSRNKQQKKQKQDQDSSSSSSSSNFSSALMIIQTADSTLNEHKFSADDLAKPDEEDVQETAERTRLELERALQRRQAAASSATGNVTAANLSSASGNSNNIKKKTEVISDGKRLIAVTEIAPDVANARRFKLDRLDNMNTSNNNNNSSIGFNNANNNNLDQDAPLVRSPTKKASVKESAEYSVVSAVFMNRNPKSKLISLEEREKHDGRNYIQHSVVSSKHADAARILANASKQTEEEEKQRSKDLAREREKLDEEKRKKLMEEAKANLLASKQTSSASGSGGNQNQDLKKDQHQRMREMQERRKLHQLERIAQSMGVDVTELLASEDEDVMPTNFTQDGSTVGNNNKKGKSSSLLGESRLVGGKNYETADSLFDSSGRTNIFTSGAEGGGGTATMARVMENVTRDGLQAEEQLQAAMPPRNNNNNDKNNKQDSDEDEDDEDEDEEDVFGVGARMKL